MGGFRVNGCGVADHYKTIKGLGMRKCPQCGKLAEFTLEEANQKIDVFFIPTVTLKSRYAVMCKKCKSGEFCSTEWAAHLIRYGEKCDIIFESEADKEEESHFLPQDGQTSQTQSTSMLPVQESSSKADVAEAAQQSVSAIRSSPFFKCPYCKVTQMREGKYCAYCGKPAPEPEENPEPQIVAQEPAPEREENPELQIVTQEPAPEAKEKSETQIAAQEPAPVAEHKPESQNAVQNEMEQKEEMVTCPDCGNIQSVNNKFCFKCGWKMSVASPGEKKCPYCGARVMDGRLFCMECGTKL